MAAHCSACGEPLPPSFRCLVCEYERETGHRLQRIPGRPVVEDVELLHLFELPRPRRRMREEELYESAARGGTLPEWGSEEPAGNMPAGYLVPNGTCTRCNAPIAWVKTARREEPPARPPALP